MGTTVSKLFKPSKKKSKQENPGVQVRSVRFSEQPVTHFKQKIDKQPDSGKDKPYYPLGLTRKCNPKNPDDKYDDRDNSNDPDCSGVIQVR